MTTIKLFIGSDNTTHKVNVAQVKEILNRYHQGWTMQNAIGSWLGTEEESVTVLITDPVLKVIQTMKVLNTELEQDAIGYQVEPELTFFDGRI